jgi:hypothetical protein
VWKATCWNCTFTTATWITAPSWIAPGITATESGFTVVARPLPSLIAVGG